MRWCPHTRRPFTMMDLRGASRVFACLSTRALFTRFPRHRAAPTLFITTCIHHIHINMVVVHAFDVLVYLCYIFLCIACVNICKAHRFVKRPHRARTGACILLCYLSDAAATVHRNRVGLINKSCVRRVYAHIRRLRLDDVDDNARAISSSFPLKRATRDVAPWPQIQRLLL